MDWEKVLIVAVGSGSVFGVLATAVFQYLAAKLNTKSRQEKSVELIQQYLKINEMTADQLEESINQVWKLSTENINMKRELSEIHERQASQDEQMEAQEAHIAAMEKQIESDTAERQVLKKIIEEKDKLLENVKNYFAELVRYFDEHNLHDYPVPSDELLDTKTRIRLKNKRGAK